MCPSKHHETMYRTYYEGFPTLSVNYKENYIQKLLSFPEENQYIQYIDFESMLTYLKDPSMFVVYASATNNKFSVIDHVLSYYFQGMTNYVYLTKRKFKVEYVLSGCGSLPQEGI